jgi:hypothetical protein
MLMVRSGLFLLLVSSVGVTLRSMEFTYVMGPLAKLICSLALSLSIACFLGTYYVSELTPHKAHIHK